MIKEENYYTVQGWMRTRLHLKGNDLHVYAMLYSFSQDGQSEFRGSLDYMSEFTGGSERNIKRCLSRLEKYGLIEKEDYHSKTGRTNGFKCIPLDKLNLQKIGQDKMSYPTGQNVLSTEDKMSYTTGQNVLPIPYINTDNQDSILKAYKKERKKIKKENPTACAREKRTYEEIMVDLNVQEPLRHELRLWTTACYNKGNIILNDVFEDLICKLFDKYGRDVNAQCKVVRNAVESGYVRIVV